MEDNSSSTILDGQIVGIRFGLATQKEICTASISDSSIGHPSQLLGNPFLGLPLEFGRCESCGTSEPGKCEGHFGYIELPIPIYHPSHISELKKLLSLLCLKCLKLKRNKFPVKDSGVAQKLLPSCCEDTILISIEEVKTTNGASCLQLKLPAKFRLSHGFWNFLERYGFRYGDRLTRTLLPCEVKEMLKRIPAESRKKLSGKGYFPQDGYILEHLPVPPNCLSVPDISDGVSVMSSDLSMTMLKKVLKQVEIIKSSRSGAPNFESHEVEAADLQSAVAQYLEIRGTAKASRDIDARYGISHDSISSTKAWLEKMRTLFIRKGSGFSSRSVITGDTYKRVNEIGVPFEIAQRITFEERVNSHNIKYLQELVDNKLCLTYGDGSSRYSLREGSKGHTFLRIGQVVHRRIMDGDIVFINRPPTTHKHSLQALSVYIHDDHTVKINPLICGPLSADFDGDCIHLFYPQSLAAKAEVVELFSVEKQLLSSHSGYLNLQLATDSLLSLKVLFKKFVLKKEVAQQLAMFVLSPLPPPALMKCKSLGSVWTASQMLQAILPDCFDCSDDRYLIRRSEVLELDFNRDIIQSLINEIVTTIFFEKGPVEVLKFFDSLQPFLMENLFMEGFSVGLEDFSMSEAALHNVEKGIQKIYPLLHRLRSTHNELAELQLEKDIRNVKSSVAKFILNSSAVGDLIDSKSDSAVSKVVQQIGFLGLQLLDKGKFYSKTLFEDVASHFESKYPLDIIYPSAKYGLVKGCFFHGLDPYEEMVHSICTREIIVRSSRGLSEPGTLFKNLMAVLRDVVICYDGTVRHFCSNSIIQFEYGVKSGSKSQSSVPAGEPVGVLAATAMSNPAYKAVLDSSPSSNSSWDMMKEILLCTVGFKNDVIDRRVILYLNVCDCGRKHCQEHAAYTVLNHLKRVSLKDTAVEFLIEYKKDRPLLENFETDSGLVAHVHLNQARLKELEIGTQEILQKCQDTIKACCKKKKLKKYVHYFKNSFLSVSESCSFQRTCDEECSDMPCLMFFFQDASENQLDKVSYIFANIIYPVLLDTIIKGDPRISSANIIWISPDTTTWIRNPNKTQQGELAIDVVLEKSVVKQSGDAWRIILDSCLPVLDLIDTRRSVPYAIKQIQELLGIACAFEQAIQRLSTSVTMVAKGVRKEHLILLANSMTFTGNLLGFNSGGYKALSRSLNVQVPFTEATLFTPRKCFEKAAEKCHTDNLSSVVASVSWGKNVAVGTGSKFDILLDPKMVGFNQENEMDVYNFLNMVRGSAGVEEVNNGCLGVEVDDLVTDDEMEWNLSPEKDSTFEKPFFDDTIENQNFMDNESEGLNWEKGSSGTGDWDTRKFAKSDSCSSWSKDETWDKFENVGSSVANLSSVWGTDVKAGNDNSWGAKGSNDNVNDTSWGQGAKGRSGSSCEPSSAKVGNDNWWGQGAKGGNGSDSSWGQSAKCGNDNSWGQGAKGGIDSSWVQAAKGGNDNSWGQGAKGGSDSSWGQDAKVGSDSSWGQGAKGGNDSSWGQGAKGGNDKSWGQGAKGGNVSSWGQNTEGDNDSSWRQGTRGGDDYSRGQGAKGGNDSSWGQGAKGGNNSSWRQDAKGGNDNSWGQGAKGGNDSSRRQDAKGGNDSLWGQGTESGNDKLWGQGAKGGNVSSWGQNTEGDNDSLRGQGSQGGDDSSWGQGAKGGNDSSWGQVAEGGNDKLWGQGAKGGSVSSWGQNAEDNNDSLWRQGAKGGDDSLRGQGAKGGNDSSWGQGAKGGNDSSWGQSAKGGNDNLWGQGAKGGDDSFRGQGTRGGNDSSWGQGPKCGNEKSWGKGAKGGNVSSWGQNAEGDNDSLYRQGAKSGDDSLRGQDAKGGNDSSWGQGAKGGVNVSSWGQDTENYSDSSWGQGSKGGNDSSCEPDARGNNDSSWGQQKSSEVSEGLANDSSQPVSSSSWDMPTRGDKESEKNQRGQARGIWKGRKNNRPPRSPAPSDSTAAGQYTVTRQRLDMFTSEEQAILFDVEPIMQSIRRIMHQSGYNDGDQLTADDKMFIVDNVFSYHPDKAVKMGAGIDHIMVNKHSSFQDSRCFFVVSTDGSSNDFSYRKCLENFIRGKYPDLADDFLGKYFRKPRGGGNRERSLPPLPEENKE